MPTRPQNSWTNLQLHDAQTVLATQAQLSPTQIWAEQIQEANAHLDRVDETMNTLWGGLTTLGMNHPEPELTTSGAERNVAAPLLDPLSSPVGMQLKVIPKALYAHVPQLMRPKIMKGVFTDFHNLLIDPLVPLRANKHVLSKNPDTGAVEWVETNTVKDIPNFDTWVKAYHTYMAIYLMGNLERALEMVKYEHLIHDASMHYEWRAVLLYDITFCQAQGEDPSHSWGITDTELYADCFTGRALPRVPQFDKAKVQKACYIFNQGRCIWRNCCYLHKCSKCGKLGHPVVCYRMPATPIATGGQDNQ